MGDKKISGTAQARKRYGLLHHLTLLWDLDFKLCECLLKEPSKRPDYRAKRTHSDFLTTFKIENLSFSQTKSEINSLLNGILATGNSKEITKSEKNYCF